MRYDPVENPSGVANRKGCRVDLVGFAARYPRRGYEYVP